jgi:hypothetical protein
VTVKVPSQRWKVVFLTDAAPLPERKFRSEGAAYQAVNRERQLIREGSSRVKRAVVYEWQKDSGRWMTFERHDLKKEAAELSTADAKAESAVDAASKGDEK